MELVLARNKQPQTASTNTSGYNGRDRGRGRGSSGNADFKRNFNCSKCDKYGDFAAQCPEPKKPIAPEVKQQESVPEKGKAKEFDEWKDQRELAAKITENLEKKKPEIPKCSEARSVQWIPVAFTEALLLETQTVDTGSILGNVFEDNNNSKNEQDEIETPMCQRIQQLTVELEDIRRSLSAVANFIKEKKKQAKAMTIEVPQVKDDEVPMIQLDFKNRKQWKPLSGVILDGGAGVHIIEEHMKENMGITNFKPASFRQLQQAARDSLVEGLPTVRSPTGVCEPCQLGKQHRVAFPKQASTRASAPLALVHTALCGPMSTSSLSGLCYMLVLVDDFSRYTWVSFLKLKSEAFGSIRDWKAMVEKEKDLKVKSICSDRGGEFLSENFARWCKSEGIRRQRTTPYTPSQNGIVERKNRTIMEMARAMLAHASLPQSYWAEVCNTAVYIQNRSPTHALQDMTPFQAYYGRKPTVSHFRVFGCSAFVHIPKEKWQKLDFKSRKLLFLGYSAESDAYRLYDPDTRTTTVSRVVVFDESFITSA
ncbi:hypothetical protein L7F22_054188 [Adiantum nelumboides]|nr:hypothetical protein [Adiantum nelumboides]